MTRLGWWFGGRVSERAKYREWIELELQGKLSPSLRTRLHDHLRANPDARAEYDRGVAAFRLLEGRGGEEEFADYELELVESWLFDGRVTGESESLAGAGEDERARGRWGWLPNLALGGAAAVAAIAIAIVVWPADQGMTRAPALAPEPEAPLTAKGHGELRGLELGVLCMERAERRAVTTRPAGDAPCSLRDVLGFEYRVRARGETVGALAGDAGVLSLFGVDEDGRVQYYAPTPVDAAGVKPTRGRSTAAPLSINLSVNHRPGRVQIYALLSPVTPTVNQIDRWASSLEGFVASTDDEPWHRRLGAAQLAAVCPALTDCESAEATLLLDDPPHEALDLPLHEVDR